MNQSHQIVAAILATTKPILGDLTDAELERFAAALRDLIRASSNGDTGRFIAAEMLCRFLADQLTMANAMRQAAAPATAPRLH
jgi:hypothetical protein